MFHIWQQKILQNSIKNNSLAHAYLFSGSVGVGKLEFAFEVAKDLLKSDPATAPDGYFYENGLTIKEVRELKKSLALSSLNSGYKVVIINNAQKLNREAANSMLKLLEEPADSTVFFLITTNSFLIPQTVRSRCFELKFGYVPNTQIEKYLNTAKIKHLKPHWSGRPAIVKKLLEDKDYLSALMAYRGDVKKFITGSLLERFKIIDKYAKMDNNDYFLQIAMEDIYAGEYKNKHIMLQQLLDLYKTFVTTNLNLQFALRAFAIK